ncbi:hypothetical protein V5N11_017134 [Cardamine amara subsp. amara]|uniref:Uncharacterized protein n=1 Tax=Cardamine amara subsp. amara TaxID=228776 RepID=A0ABD1A859_CARAN
MEDNETKKSEVEVDGLGLIDVASEDDSLLFSSFPDPTSYVFSETEKDENCFKDDKDSSFLRDDDTQCCDEEEILVSSIEDKEDVLQPHESPEPEKVMKKGKYNLRKSLAWDNAFFTSEGFLEPEELSSMMETNRKSGKKALPTIQEDINRSTESISTFQSDCTVDNSQEFALFEDVRASIQRSAKATDAATPGKYNELGATQVAISPTSSTVDGIASQEKTKPKASIRNPSIRAPGLGKATKQPVATRGLSTSISKPPNGFSKVRPLSTTSTKLDNSKTKQGNNSKLPAGKEPVGPRISISRRVNPILPKPGVPSKSSLRSSAASKNEMTSSCSSLESCASASSSASHKPSLNSIKNKNDSSSRLASQSLANRSTPRGIMGQPRITPHPTNKTSKSKLSSTVPSVSSTSDCSSESLRASATSKVANGNQKMVSGEKSPANDNSVQIVKPLKNSKDASVVQADAREATKRVSAINGSLVPPTSMKPSGLRVPSPNIGFFDGGRHGSSSSASKRSGKTQPLRSPRLEPSNSKTKVSSRLVSASSPKLYSKINAEDQLEG